MPSFPASVYRRHREKRSIRNPECWSGSAEDLSLRCKACCDIRPRNLRSAIRHEDTQGHARCLKHWQFERERDAEEAREEARTAEARRAAIASAFSSMLSPSHAQRSAEVDLELRTTILLYAQRLQARTTESEASGSNQLSANAPAPPAQAASALDLSHLDIEWQQPPVTFEAACSAGLAAYMAGGPLFESDSDSGSQDRFKQKLSAAQDSATGEDTNALPVVGPARASRKDDI